MDVVWGETAGVDGQLWLLCPILFILQVFISPLNWCSHIQMEQAYSLHLCTNSKRRPTLLMTYIFALLILYTLCMVWTNEEKCEFNTNWISNYKEELISAWLTKAVVFTKLYWWAKKIMFFCCETDFDT